MSWSCPHCEKSLSGKDSMKRHINNRHSNPGHFTPFNAMHYSAERCQRFQLEHPFTCMVATGLKNRQACALSSRLQMFQNGGPRIGFRHVIEPLTRLLIQLFKL